MFQEDFPYICWRLARRRFKPTRASAGYSRDVMSTSVIDSVSISIYTCPVYTFIWPHRSIIDTPPGNYFVWRIFSAVINWFITSGKQKRLWVSSLIHHVLHNKILMTDVWRYCRSNDFLFTTASNQPHTMPCWRWDGSPHPQLHHWKDLWESTNWLGPTTWQIIT